MWNGYTKGELMEGIDPELLWPFLRRLRVVDDHKINENLSRIMSIIYTNKPRRIVTRYKVM